MTSVLARSTVSVPAISHNGGMLIGILININDGVSSGIKLMILIQTAFGFWSATMANVIGITRIKVRYAVNC